MEASERRRRRWNDADNRRRPEDSLYAEWLRAERTTGAVSPRDTTRRQSLALQQNGSTSIDEPDLLGATIRPVTPEDSDAAMDEESSLPERSTDSFEEAFLPRTASASARRRQILGTTTTTIIGGPAALTGPAAPGVRSSKHSRRLVKERESRSLPSGHNGSGLTGMLARSSSKSGTSSPSTITPTSNGNRTTSIYDGDAYNGVPRQRTRTLDERRREREPAHMLRSSRNRVGSVNNMPSSGAEYLASVPASTSPPEAPSILSLSSPVQSPSETGRRSTSDTSSANNSMTSTSNPPRRIQHLCNVLKGRMSGHVSLRRASDHPWHQLYCYIEQDTGRLMYESKGGDGADRALVSALGGCNVRPNTDGEQSYLEVTLPNSDTEIHFKLLTQADLESWYAALLWWQYKEPSLTERANGHRPPSATSAGYHSRPELPPRTSSARDRPRDRADSNRSDRRKSVVTPKEAPVIKIGTMIYWDTNVGYSNTPGSAAVGSPASGRPAKYRMQSQSSRRWRRISGQLRENGELKLHADADNSLISVVQLSQLSRCAIQRLDPSVLDNEYCIAIYPQYTSGHSNSQPGFVRPIFLSLENRVLYEVWFVLLRAFTIPQLYGPPPQDEQEESQPTRSLDDKLATTISDMFRLERTLNFRIVEAKIFPPTASNPGPEAGFSGGRAHAANVKPEQHGYYAEVLLDDETRGKTNVKYDGLTPLWGESFEFLDLPAVLSNVSVLIKRRPPESAHAREQAASKLVHEAYGFTSDQHGGFTGLTFDVTCGKVEVYLHELEGDKEVEKWWPIVNSFNQRVGEILLKTRMNEGVILMEKDYEPLSEMLHRFGNGLTLQVAQIVPSELKRVSDCLLNIFQVSGKVGEWLMALVEDEIDGIHKETPITRLRYTSRVASDASNDSPGLGLHADRELIVRDMNKNATLEANLLFRGNTLLTKSLDIHMRRVGKEYLEAALASKIKEINEKEPDCEVDPNRVNTPADLERNWRRLLHWTKEVWQAIVSSKDQCPVELRLIFRHIRACAEDRYGDFLRSVSYSSVSGFLFLRFFCPAILNPKLFGLLKEEIKPKARRTLTLIAKSLQTLSNMASFGAKETWMEHMNVFLTQSRESFKTFIDDMCYVPVPVSGPTFSTAKQLSTTYPPGVVSAETNLSYTTPMTIMQRLPPTSREGFPSLPYLIDQARAFAELVQVWLEATTEETARSTASLKSHAELMAAIKASEGELTAFHEICTKLSKRTQECLSRAERAERPNSALSFRWEELIDQLQPSNSLPDSGDEFPMVTPQGSSLDTLAERVAPTSHLSSLSREWTVVSPDDEVVKEEEEEEEEDPALATRLYNITPSLSTATSAPSSDPSLTHNRDRDREANRPGSSGVVTSLRDSLRRALPTSRASDAGDTPSASASNVSSDTEHSAGTTALPSYDRERRHRERREAAKAQIKQEVEAARVREKERERERGGRRVKTPIVSALRKKKEREREV
ncbi:GTPase activating factor [Saxophila tyrrhenica]|uniref:GTPase activating factor n=1 Tax=Saxophila tyrrhenica TaxID=1690608 RepID=A0AAV9P5M6_9PEZI|nr:GTPase activating factor [Saxophila tyrrhenica]